MLRKERQKSKNINKALGVSYNDPYYSYITYNSP